MESGFKDLGSLIMGRMSKVEREVGPKDRERLEERDSWQQLGHRDYMAERYGIQAEIVKPAKNVSPLEETADLRLTRDEQLELSYYPIEVLEMAVTAWRRKGQDGRAFPYLKKVCENHKEQGVSLKQRIKENKLSNPKSDESESFEDTKLHGQRMPNCSLPEKRVLCPYAELNYTLNYMNSEDYKWHTREGYRHRDLYINNWAFWKNHCEQNVLIAMEQGIPNPYQETHGY